MKPIDKYNDYLKDQKTSMESDDLTKEIISDFHKEELLKERWEKILKDKHNYGNSETAAAATDPKIGNKKNVKRIFLVTLMGAAATLLWFFYVNIGQTVIPMSPVDQLLSEHYQKPFNRDILKGPSSTSERRSEAYFFYQNKEYAKAIPLLESLITEGTIDPEATFFLGLSYLYNEQPEDGAKQFKTVLAGAKNNYQDIATWYLALALTDAAAYEEAKIHLSTVANWTGNAGKVQQAKDAMDLIKVINEMQ